MDLAGLRVWSSSVDPTILIVAIKIIQHLLLNMSEGYAVVLKIHLFMLIRKHSLKGLVVYFIRS